MILRRRLFVISSFNMDGAKGDVALSHVVPGPPCYGGATVSAPAGFLFPRPRRKPCGLFWNC